MHERPFDRRGLAFAAMLCSPLFFATNLIFGSLTGAEVAPFTLAFLRWAAAALLLAPLMLRYRAPLMRSPSSIPLLVLLGFLGMWMCGGPVYLALTVTTATNGALIFTTTPVFIILIETIFRGRPVRGREMVGSALALSGVATIVLQGDPLSLFALSLNYGDLIMVAAVIGWAWYSILCRSPRLAGLTNLSILAYAAAGGALLLAPFALHEWLTGAAMPRTTSAWAGIAGIIIFPSLLAFSTHQFGMRVLTPPVASMFMYLMPVYGVLMAVTILGEPFAVHQAVGIALVMGGVILATMPTAAIGRLVGPRPA